MPQSAFEKEMEKVDYWLTELRSLGVDAKKKNDLNDSKELHDLTENIKETLYHEYKAAYAQA